MQDLIISTGSILICLTLQRAEDTNDTVISKSLYVVRQNPHQNRIRSFKISIAPNSGAFL